MLDGFSSDPVEDSPFFGKSFEHGKFFLEKICRAHQCLGRFARDEAHLPDISVGRRQNAVNTRNGAGRTKNAGQIFLEKFRDLGLEQSAHAHNKDLFIPFAGKLDDLRRDLGRCRLNDQVRTPDQFGQRNQAGIELELFLECGRFFFMFLTKKSELGEGLQVGHDRVRKGRPDRSSPDDPDFNLLFHFYLFFTMRFLRST